jgi:outer membrane protein assembly factor BamB
VPLTPSPLLAGDQIYFVSDNGIATCLDAETGRELWRARLEGEYSASPVLAAGRIYFQNEAGKTTVIQPGTSFQKLAENEIDGSTLASMAAVGNVILLRSNTHLYRIEGE